MIRNDRIGYAMICYYMVSENRIQISMQWDGMGQNKIEEKRC